MLTHPLGPGNRNLQDYNLRPLVFDMPQHLNRLNAAPNIMLLYIMSCQFMSVMALTLSAAKELNKPILLDLLSDYAKRRTNNKMQYILIHILAKKHSQEVSEENRVMYNVIRRYLERNAVSVTRELLWAD